MSESAIANPLDAPTIAVSEPRPALAPTGRTISATALGAATGLLLWLCYFPVAWAWLAWAALIPLLCIAVGQRSRWAVFFGSWIAGLTFFMPALEWLRVAHPMMYLTWIGLALYLSFYLPVAAGLIRVLHRRTVLPLLVTVPVVWTALEFVRAHLMTGFAWYFLGHSQHDILPLIQISDVTGAYGVSFVVAAVNALLLEALTSSAWFRGRFGLSRSLVSLRTLCWHTAGVGVLLAVVLGYGVYRLSETPFTDGPRVALLQCNLEQGVRNDASGNNKKDAVTTVIQQNEDLANLAARANPRPDLIVWSETSFPYFWSQLADGVRRQDVSPLDRRAAENTERGGVEIAEAWKTPVLLGAVREVIPSASPPECDLRLMFELLDASGIPTEDKNRIIVADVNRLLHFRIFDSAGQMVVDTDENQLPKQAGAIHELREKLETLRPPHELTNSDNAEVATTVVSIVGHARPSTRYNAAILIDQLGYTVAAYGKMHRVPFGEYTPLRETVPWLRALTPYERDDFSVAAGEQFTRFPLGDFHFGVVICYEDSDPTLARQYVAPGEAPVDFLLNISNDGWFRGTREHEQHLATCRFRAVECRRSVARAVNMGVSAVIDGNGRVLAPERTDAGRGMFLARVESGAGALPVERWHEYKSTPGVVTAVVPIDHRFSLYAAWGDWLPWSCGGLALAALLVGVFRPKRYTDALAV